VATKIFFEPDLFLTNLANLEGETKENEEKQKRLTSIIELVSVERSFDVESMASFDIEDIDRAIEAVEALRSPRLSASRTDNELGAAYICNMIDVQHGKDNLRHMKMLQIASSTDFF